MANTNLREFIKVVSENFELGEGVTLDLEGIPEVELPEKFNDNFHKQYLTLLSAKNNKEVMGHFRGQYLNNADGKLKASYLSNGGTEDDFNDLKAKEPDSMKLIELVLADSVRLNSTQNAPSGTKEHEAYKIQTAKQIDELLKEKEGFEDRLLNTVNDTRSEWSSKLKTSMIESQLNSKSFNDSMSKEDSVFLTMRKLEKSPFELRLDSDLKQSVYNKETGMEAVVDGKNIDWSYVIDDSSYEYTKKNAQAQTPEPPRIVNAPVVNANASEDGRYIPGHVDYGKK